MDVVFHERYLDHRQYGNHPECPERLVMIRDALESYGLFDVSKEPTAAEQATVETVHDHDFVETVKNFGEGFMDPDTYIREETYEIALVAVGGFMQSVSSALSGRPSIALVRPPGHHSGREYNCGFCYFNNIAIGAESVASRGERVAIVDIDVHHGNGTNDIFRSRKDVLYISTHQWGIFPGTGPIGDVGEGEGEGYTVNIPLPSRSGDATYASAMEEIILPVLRVYKPEALMVSIGCDAHYMDPLASLSLSTPGYVSAMRSLLQASRELCGGRLAIALEGGYHLAAQAEVMAGTVALDTEIDTESRFTDVRDTECLGREALDAVLEAQSAYWTL